MMQKYLLGEIDFKFDIRHNSSFQSNLICRSNDLHLPCMHTNWGKQTFIYLHNAQTRLFWIFSLAQSQNIILILKPFCPEGKLCNDDVNCVSVLL